MRYRFHKIQYNIIVSVLKLNTDKAVFYFQPRNEIHSCSDHIRACIYIETMNINYSSLYYLRMRITLTIGYHELAIGLCIRIAVQQYNSQ